ncbi:helix-turn-helix domain-containing protein [Rhodothalassium salexigens]|uniref:helix-turn-helix domain-containing protein n=1 Tax=Rhodothalassium salexigens TaxID=1086 RepID=UPI00237B6A09|nr:helix-turn-helix transcriptional regulator [Rhodothalassium salexigens]
MLSHEWTYRDLRRARVLLSMSQEAFGFALGVSRNWVSEMERGRATIEARTVLSCLYLLSRRYGWVVTSLDELSDVSPPPIQRTRGPDGVGDGQIGDGSGAGAGSGGDSSDPDGSRT